MDIGSVFGFVGAACTTFAFVPQAIKIIKTKNTKDISLTMYIVFVIGIACWLAYGLFIDSMPVILSNIVSIILSGTILILKIKYK
jgi:MtN3 and saliva related transmembrane protein